LLDEGVIGVFNNMPVILWSDAEFYVFGRAAWEGGLGYQIPV